MTRDEWNKSIADYEHAITQLEAAVEAKTALEARRVQIQQDYELSRLKVDRLRVELQQAIRVYGNMSALRTANGGTDEDLAEAKRIKADS